MFAVLGVIAVALITGTMILAMTGHSTDPLHGSLIFILGVVGGYAYPKIRHPDKPPE
jgi:hypothetical protein